MEVGAHRLYIAQDSQSVMYTTHYTDDPGDRKHYQAMNDRDRQDFTSVSEQVNGSHHCTSRGPALYIALFYVILDIHPILWQIKPDIPIVH